MSIVPLLHATPIVLPGMHADNTLTPGAARGTLAPKLEKLASVSVGSTAATGRMQLATRASDTRLAGLHAAGLATQEGRKGA